MCAVLGVFWACGSEDGLNPGCPDPEPALSGLEPLSDAAIDSLSVAGDSVLATIHFSRPLADEDRGFLNAHGVRVIYEFQNLTAVAAKIPADALRAVATYSGVQAVYLSKMMWTDGPC